MINTEYKKIQCSFILPGLKPLRYTEKPCAGWPKGNLAKNTLIAWAKNAGFKNGADNMPRQA